MRQLSEGGLISVRQLSSHLLAHVNSGKRTKRVVPIRAAIEDEPINNVPEPTSATST